MHSLRLHGEYLMMDGQPVDHDLGFTVGVLAGGTKWGNAEPLTKTLNTLATSGSWEVVERFGNRLPSLSVEISAPDPHALNDGEKWLSALMRPGSLEWLPPLSDVWTVFDVVTATLDIAQDDDWDLDERRFTRTYTIPIRALPHARSATQVVTGAETDALDVLVDDGTSTAGWSGSGVVTSEAGAIVNTFDGSSGLSALTRTGAIATTDTPYLQVDWQASHPGFFDVTTSADPYNQLAEARRDVLTSGFNRSYYRLPDSVASVSWVRFGYVQAPQGPGETFKVDQIRVLSAMPFSATTRQKTTAIYPGGSAPAEGDLHVYHPSSALGRTVVHTYPMGRPSPALMQHRVASETPLPDPTTLNGEYIPLQPGELQLNVADFSLPTRGLAAIWAKVQVNAATSGGSTEVGIRWTVRPWSNGSEVGPIETGVISIAPANEARILIPIALATLPPVVTGTAGSAVITLQREVGEANVYVDEVWAFGQDEESATTIVDCGEGTPTAGQSGNHLWINAPTPEAPAGQVLIGTNVENARWPQVVQSSQLHRFPPDGVAVLVATTNATDPAIELAHYRRWTHHAGD